MAKISFLRVESSPDWFEIASSDLRALLSDHLHCERKASENALSLVRRYPSDPAFVEPLARLAHEETSHLIQVSAILNRRGMVLLPDMPNHYTRGLLSQVRPREPNRRLDALIVAALIEARSHERLGLLAEGFAQKLMKNSPLSLRRWPKLRSATQPCSWSSPPTSARTRSQRPWPKPDCVNLRTTSRTLFANCHQALGSTNGGLWTCRRRGRRLGSFLSPNFFFRFFFLALALDRLESRGDFAFNAFVALAVSPPLRADSDVSAFFFIVSDGVVVAVPTTPLVSGPCARAPVAPD